MQHQTSAITVAEQSPDHAIVAAILGGDKAACNDLIERYWGRIFSRVYQMLGSFEDAEEITSDTFSRAIINLSRFRFEASLSTWLYQIASNLARNRYWYWKRRRRERSLSLDTPLNEDGLTLHQAVADDCRNPAQAAHWDELCSAIEGHLQGLPLTHRTVMEMRLFENRSYEEISHRLNIPIGTVKSRISRARECLGRSLGLQSRADVRDFLTRAP